MHFASLLRVIGRLYWSSVCDTGPNASARGSHVGRAQPGSPQPGDPGMAPYAQHAVCRRKINQSRMQRICVTQDVPATFRTSPSR